MGLFFGSVAVLLNALVVHGLYFGWAPWTWGYALAIGLLVAPAVALLDLWWARWQLNKAQKVFLGQAEDLQEARQAYRNLAHWPLLSVVRVMGPHLLATMGGFLLAIGVAHRFGGFPTSPLDMLYLLPWYPINAALHAVVEYMVGASQSPRLLAYLRERFGDEVAVHPRLRIPFFFKVLGVLLALGLLPLLQVASLVYFREKRGCGGAIIPRFSPRHGEATGIHGLPHVPLWGTQHGGRSFCGIMCKCRKSAPHVTAITT